MNTRKYDNLLNSEWVLEFFEKKYDDYKGFDYLKKGEQKIITNKQKWVEFKDTFDLINELNNRKEYMSSYFLLYSVFEDRFNSLWYTLYYSLNNINDLNKPQLNYFKKHTILNKIRDLYFSSFFTCEFSKRLHLSVLKRNIKFHQTLWVRKSFTIDDNNELLYLIRNLEKIKRKMLKQFETK